MMKRYYIAKIIGDGTEENPYRPAVADHRCDWTANIPSDPTTGRPVHTHCLAVVAAQDHAAIIADPLVDVLPDYPLDAKISAMHQATKTAMLNRLRARGFDLGDVSSVDGYREIVRMVGRKFEPAFNENKFDVNEN